MNTRNLVFAGIVAIAVLELHLIEYAKVAWILAWHDMGFRNS